jgi:sporulation protein YlmC with PRC-barrel domain
MGRRNILVLLLAVVIVPILCTCSGIAMGAEVSSSEAGGRPARLRGIELDSPAGEKLGKVEDVLLDMETDTIRYLVVSFQDPSVYDKAAMAINREKLIPIPWPLFTTGLRPRTLVLDADVTRLAQAPHLRTIPASLSIDLERQIDAYWNQGMGSGVGEP